MTVGRLGERGIIARLVTRFRAVGTTNRLLRGPGDDGAVVAFKGDPQLVLTSDVLIEGVHFRSEWMPPACLGHKALAVSLSDLAAMGARPEVFLLDLGAPPHWPVSALDAFAGGMAELAQIHGIALAGGDTVASPELHVGITAIGRSEAGRSIGRDGARPGDRLAISGTLGGAAAGLRLLEAGWRRDEVGRAHAPHDADPGPLGRAAPMVLAAHLLPLPPVELGPALAGVARAAIDVSDGLARDLENLCNASRCGARLDVDALPVDPAARSVFAAEGIDPLEAAVAGGEDYRLLAALPPELDPSTLGLIGIGEVVPVTDGLALRGPAGEHPLPTSGFRHFPTS